MISLDFIHWAPQSIAFHIGNFPIRWYSICWCIALLLGYYFMKQLYKKQSLSQQLFEPLFVYCFVGVLVGARLGHCLFYEPSYFLTHPVEMLLPIKHLPDGWKLVGYEGLASHGGVIGMLISLYFYCKKTGMKYLHLMDNMGIIAPISSAFIRLGNLMNSEIVGMPTDKPWGFIFSNNGEEFPRHPGQLYEALAYLLIFLIILIIYHYKSKRIATGLYFGICLASIFIFRIFVEFFKANQEAFEEAWLLNVGQLLSLPLVFVGIWFLWQSRKKPDYIPPKK